MYKIKNKNTCLAIMEFKNMSVKYLYMVGTQVLFVNIEKVLNHCWFPKKERIGSPSLSGALVVEIWQSGGKESRWEKLGRDPVPIIPRGSLINILKWLTLDFPLFVFLAFFLKYCVCFYFGVSLILSFSILKNLFSEYQKKMHVCYKHFKHWELINYGATFPLQLITKR